jgi:hypothetical protein
MINSNSPKSENIPTSLASLYPEAFAMAIASNSRFGLALRLAENAALNPDRIYVDKSISDRFTKTN